MSNEFPRYTKHTAVIQIQFEAKRDDDPDEIADQIVRDLHDHGFGGAWLEDVMDVDPSEEPQGYLKPVFVLRNHNSLGVDQNLEAHFVIGRTDSPHIFIVESVDVFAEDIHLKSYNHFGGVGGEVIVKASYNGRPDPKAIATAWVSLWKERFFCLGDDTLIGLWHIIKKIVMNGEMR